MASQLTNYRVFIASPGGLEPERRMFKEILSAHNDADAIARSCHFQAVGWEITLGGVGRPQEKINEELRQCDLFVLILWDRWGTPTGAKEGYTSGTQEEYKIALESLKDENVPMREIVVFFKAVEPRRLSDPGPQLAAVLDFKRTLEQERTLLFETFDVPEAFGEKLRRHAAKWTRDHENHTVESNPSTGDPKISDKDPEIQASDPADLNLIEKLKDQGGYTETEKQLAHDVTIKRDMRSFDRYGIFLIQEERYADALSLYQQMHDLADGAGDLAWASTAIARIGGVYRAQGRTAEAQSTLLNALQLKERIGDAKGASAVHGWLGDLNARQRKGDVAVKHYLAALDTAPEKSQTREAEIKWKLAKCYAEMGDTESAKVAASEAHTLYKQQGNRQGLLAIKSWRKSRKLG